MSCIYYSYTVAEPHWRCSGHTITTTTYYLHSYSAWPATAHSTSQSSRGSPPATSSPSSSSRRASPSSATAYPSSPPRPIFSASLLRIASPLSSASSTSDLTDSTEHLRPLLRRAYDSLSGPLADFLSSAATPPVDWLLCDYASYWAVPVARSLNVRTAFLSLFGAAALGSLGPPDELIRPRRLAPEDFTVAPDWVPFPTSVAFRLPEARTAFGRTFSPDASGVSKAYRFGVTVRECDLVAVRSCVELEQEWLDLLKDIYGKTVLPVGHFPPVAPKESVAAASLKDWTGAFEWLDKRAHGSVVYVAFGSEVRLNREQVREIARGLELSGLPFIWALRWPNGLKEVLPEGFEDRTAGRGMVCQGWVPQVRLLGHPAVGGFMTHCGWSSVTEGLQFGLALILVPMIFDQALSARLLEEKRVGKEVPRNDEDGAFDAIGISETLRLVMVEEGGKGYRARSRELKSVIGSKEVQDSYVTKFVEHLKSHRPA
ncbi:UDP-glycosyltransferase 91C1-like [Iris pallida]|uniref:UDP-glycosyltransferase 91C1-like n=1 Tax=Iris pallida TaxID=29817 RepID=A0AAX6GE53_IRIPA|nr:UDP-glycosyltransferase 91C1-like [Iris pallida]